MSLMRWHTRGSIGRGGGDQPLPRNQCGDRTGNIHCTVSPYFVPTGYDDF
jgi:hypothetical protein